MAPDSTEASEFSIEEALHSENGVLTVGSMRAVVTTQPAYTFLMKILHEHAPHVIKYAFYDMGYKVGQELMNASRVDASEPEKAFRYLVETYRQSGYGDMQVLHFDLSLPEARLAGTNLFETEVAKASGVYRTPRSVDHYSRGIFAGFLSTLLGKEVVCEEVACQHRGDERCEFVVLPFER